MVKTSTGVALIDSLLGGGLNEESATMIYGPSFAGKEVFARLFLLQGLKEGVPAVAVLTDCTADQMRRNFTTMDAHFPTYEKKGLIHFVDAYAPAVDPSAASSDVGDGIADLRKFANAIRSAQKKVAERASSHRFLFDSVSTVLAQTEPAEAFRFLQGVVGRARQSGATSALTLQHGMHSPEAVHSVRHLMDGVVEFKNDRGKRLLQVEAAHLSDDIGWVDYRFDANGLEITGSFAGGRIRGHRLSA